MRNLLNRRQFLTLCGVGTASVILPLTGCSGLAAPAAKASPRRPNIILILSDDMGYSDIGCYGGEINTPTLDALAAGGLRFTKFYNSARCCPTRASLLTGLYPHQAGIGHMLEDRGQDGYRGNLNNRCVTIAEVLKMAGYSTYMVGKWHITRFFEKEGPRDNWPLQRGFDKYYGTLRGSANFYDPASLTRGNTLITPENDPEYKSSLYYYTDALSDNAVKFISEHQKENGSQPFFLYVAYTAAHWPMHAKPQDIAKYKGKYNEGYEPIRKARYERLKKLGLIPDRWGLSPQAGDWDKVRDKEWEARCMEVYAAMIDSMDQGIGRIVAELKRQGKLDDTLIFFLQDNGGCAEPMGRTDKPEFHLENLKPMGPNDLQLRTQPPMQTRDGRPVRCGPDVMPGPADSYISYGRSWANVSNTPFREYKHWVQEGGISTPLIVHWPAYIHDNGKLRSEPGHLIDIMATCVDVAAAQYPTRYKDQPITPAEGVSLMPVFGIQPLGRSAIYWEHEGNRAVREGQWKLISKADAKATAWDMTEVLPLDMWELYDMEADRPELHDLAKQYPDKVRQMAQMWQTWAQRAMVVPRPDKKNAARSSEK
jgi:arylsulfatase A-like enzyme